MRILSSYLEDRWQAGQAPNSTLYNATSEEACAEVSSKGLDLAAALAYARTRGGPTLRAMTFAQRAEMLAAMSATVHENREELIAMSVENCGNTRKDAKFDIDGASGTLAYYAGLGRKLGDKTFLLDGDQVRISRSKRFMGQHILSPRLGVAVHINAFNFPAWNLAEKAAAALLAGVPVLSKPATATATVAERVVQLWHERDLLPSGTFSLLCGSAGDLLDHVRSLDCIVFTGSGDTAARIRGHANVVARNVPVNVEADSLNAAVLGPDVEPGSDTFYMFIAEVSHEITHRAGQKCTAVRRILVPEALLTDTVEALKDRLDGAVLGDPNESATTVGPVSTPAQQRDISAGVAKLAACAERVWGDPDSIPDSGFYVAPQLFLARGGVDASFVHDEEIFGPVATILPWSGDADEAVDIVARGGGGLVTSVFSDDLAWSQKVLFGLAPWHGRILWGSAKVHDQSTGHGTVMPSLVHGGPGKAGGGEELGGERGLRFYWQRTAIQGDTSLLKRVLGSLDA